ncbi:hypothetical protein DPO11_20430 [Salmonella enterica]|nr:hypothetical protein [Salmonella enterica]
MNKFKGITSEAGGVATDNYKGLALEPEVAFLQIAVMIDAALIFSVVDREELSDTSDYILFTAKKYAEAACEALSEEKNKELQTMFGGASHE